VKHLAVVLALVALVYAGLDLLADATQTRPDPLPPGSRSEVVFRVGTRPGRAPRPAAEGLWHACQAQTIERRLLPPGVVEVDDRTYRVVVRPGLGPHAERRLRGCLEDVTVDRVKGHVLRIRAL
jgi:hypothetical protein